MNTSYIYAMVDPRTGDPFYIGVTRRPLRRFMDHMRRNAKNERLRDRIGEMQANSIRPKLRILESVDEHQRAERESHWILCYLKNGADLCNIDVLYRRGKRLDVEAIENRGNWATLSASISKDQMKQIEQMAESEGKDKSEVIRRLLSDALSLR